jgi:hypothetical protein
MSHMFQVKREECRRRCVLAFKPQEGEYVNVGRTGGVASIEELHSGL